MNSSKFRHMKVSDLCLDAVFFSSSDPGPCLTTPWHPTAKASPPADLPEYTGVSQLCLGCPGKVAAWTWEDLKAWLGRAGRKAGCRSYVRAPASPRPAGWPNFRTTITFEGQANFRLSLITGSFKALMMVLWWKRGWFWEPEMSEKWCSGHDQGKVAWPVGTAGQS